MATYYPSTLAFTQYSDSTTGAPLSGGTIEAYLAGTPTPVAMYKDGAGTSVGSVVTLNSGGYPAASGAVIIIWLKAGVSYKFILKNSSGSTIATGDDLSNALLLASTTKAYPSLEEFILESVDSSIKNVDIISYFDGWESTAAGPKGGHKRHRTGATNSAPTVGSAVAVSTIGVGTQAGYCWTADGAEWYISKSQSISLDAFGGVADYAAYNGTDNTVAIQAFFNYLAASGVEGTVFGLYKFASAISVSGISSPITVRFHNNQQAGFYYTGTTGDAITFTNCYGLNLINFSVVGAYSTATSVTNKGLVLRQCVYAKSRSMIIANFRDNVHHDGGYLHHHEDLLSSNYRRSPLWYSYNEYGDTANGMAHNQYTDMVVAHEYGGAGRGVYITHGELLLDNPRAEDYGQKFINIAYVSATVKNIIINNPTCQSDASGTLGVAFKVDGSGGAVRSVYVNNPDFISETGFNVVEISGSGVEGVYISGGNIREGEHGVSVTSSARRVYIFPDLIESCQKNGIYCASGGDSNFFGPKTMRNNNVGATLAGDALAHIYLDTSANSHVIGTRFEDAANGVLYGVSSSIGATTNTTSNISTNNTSLILRNDVQDTNILSGSKTHDWASIAAGATATTTVTVPFALTSHNKVSVYMNISTQGLVFTGYVSASGTVTVTASNPTSGAIDLASATLSVDVMKQ